MLTVAQLLQAHDDGEITRNELFAHILAVLEPADVESLQRRFAGDEELRSFEEWVDDLAAGAQVFIGGEPVHLSGAAHEAIALWRRRTQAARYARLARSINGWASRHRGGEVAIDSVDVEPFVSRSIEALLTEAA